MYYIQVDKLCVEDQAFGAATTVPNYYLGYQFDGAVGMGFVADPSASAANDLPWFYNLMNKSSNFSENPYFTFYLNRCRVCVCLSVCVCTHGMCLVEHK